MTYEDKRAWLRGYRDALQRQRVLEGELERLRAEAERVTPLLTGQPGAGGDGERLPRAVERMVEAQAGLAAQLAVCEAARRRVAAAIESVPGQRDREVLTRRYLWDERFEQIAVDMRLEYRWVRRLHKRAVQAVQIPGEMTGDKN